MNAIISKLLNRASDLADVEPTIALFLAAALLAIFLTALFQSKSAAADEKNFPSFGRSIETSGDESGRSCSCSCSPGRFPSCALTCDKP